jgi:hypothetical protein
MHLFNAFISILVAEKLAPSTQFPGVVWAGGGLVCNPGEL